jgi:nicotinamide-nucleotide amidase
VFDSETLALAEAVLVACRRRNWRLATAESCTGGLVAAALTAIAGSSDVVERGFVTYSNQAKSDLLGVPADTIAGHGGVSAQTAAAMARGAVARAGVDLAVSITGIAGPGGGTPEKPVGLMCFGIATSVAARSECRHVPGTNRTEIRHAAMRYALHLLAVEVHADYSAGLLAGSGTGVP